MKHIFFYTLLTVGGLLIADKGHSQTEQHTSGTPGIVIVPALEKPGDGHRSEKKDMAGYLLVYFKDQTQSAYLAISRDGYVFTDVNGGEPVFDGTLLAEQKGVRDPHIARGPDGLLPCHDRSAYLRTAGRSPDYPMGKAPGGIWLGKQPRHSTDEILRPDTLDSFRFSGR